MVRWSEDAVPADAPVEGRSVLRRVLAEIGELREAGFGLARGIVALGFVVVVLLFGLRYANEGADPAVVVRAPTFVSVPAVVPPPPQAQPPPAETAKNDFPFGPRHWYLRQDMDFRQDFAALGQGAKALCAELAASGFPRARWAASQMFPGEWECFSPSAEAPGAGKSFVVVRGRSSEAAGSVMLKSNAASPEAQGPFRARAEDILAHFALASGTALDPELAARLAEWKAGTFKHGVQTLRIAKEYGRSDANAVNLAILPLLPLPTEGSCGPDCFALKPASPVKAPEGAEAAR